MTELDLPAQRLALAAWWESQVTKRKKALAWIPQFCTAHHQVRLHALLGAFRERKKSRLFVYSNNFTVFENNIGDNVALVIIHSEIPILQAV